MRNYPTIQDIREAQERLQPHIRHTPLLRAEKIEKAAGCRLYLKPEALQITGAFKIRGALNKALSLSKEEIANGIIATSSGNHAQGLAYAARMLGVKAILVLPVTTPKIKIENTKALGAEVILSMVTPPPDGKGCMKSLKKTNTRLFTLLRTPS